MKQSKTMSFIETCVSTAIGFGVALLTQVVVFPWFDMHPSLHENLLISTIFTVVSIIRGYCVRRLFNAIRPTLRSLS